MPLCQTRSRNDLDGHFTERFQQAFSSGLSRSPFGITSKETSQFFLLLTQALTHYAFQQSQNTQGQGEQADQPDAVVIFGLRPDLSER